MFNQPGQANSLQLFVVLPAEISVEHSSPPFSGFGLLHNLDLF